MRAADAEALLVRCPQCKAHKFSPCVYMTDLQQKSRWDYRTQRYVVTSLAVARIGTPLANGRVHDQRGYRAHKAAEQERFRKKFGAKVPKIHPALLAVRRFDLAEYVAMQAFLRRWGPILWSKPWAVVYCPDCGIASCDGNCEADRIEAAEREQQAMDDEVTEDEDAEH